MKTYTWKTWIIPDTPCPLIGKDYSKMKEIQIRLTDRYPEYEFCLKAIAPHTWQMMFSE